MHNFWISRNLSLINCEIELDMSCSKNLVLSQDNYSLDSATFQINSTKFYAPVVTLSISNDFNFLEHLRQGFRKTVSWSKYRPEITAILQYYMPLHAISQKKRFYIFWSTWKKQTRSICWNIKKKNNDYTTGNLLDYSSY